MTAPDLNATNPDLIFAVVPGSCLLCLRYVVASRLGVALLGLSGISKSVVVTYPDSMYAMSR